MIDGHLNTQENSMLLTVTRTTLALILILLSTVSASVLTDLDAASKTSKTAFVLVTAPGTQGMESARAMVTSAMGASMNGVLLEMDRTAPENADLVAKYGLASAPVPLVLVFASNGILAGGLPAQMATPEKIVALVPSPKKTEVLSALQAGKSVFIVVSKPTMSAREGAASGCAMACSQLAGKSQYIEVNMDDAAEAEFLKQLKVDLQSAEPVTVVVNAGGQVTGSYLGAVDVGQLVQAATKQASAGCAPSGCGGKPCGPAPTKKEGK
jgi:hypothetical protein